MTCEDVYLELTKIGCCSRCCLRFVGDTFSNFEDPLHSLKELLSIPLENEIKTKKLRQNTCCLCLGLLEDSFLDELLAHSCWKRLQEYETDNYRINLNMPPNITIRDKALSLYLKEKFPAFYESNKLENLPLIQMIFKLGFKRRLDEHCGKKYDVHSGVQLRTTLCHDDNDKEMEVMQKLDNMGYGRQRFSSQNVYSKNSINNILSSIDDKKFVRFVKIPPEIPSNPLHIESVTFENLPIFFGGRYCKYSRVLSQTPWNVDNVENSSTNDGLQINNEMSRNITSSVLNILEDGLQQVFGFDKKKITFTASGREDADVRCLGSGRPFFLKIECVKKTFPDELFRKLEDVINESPDVSVFDMQQVDKISVKQVKSGEEKKRKTYVALCFMKESTSVEETVARINRIERNLVIAQKTPIRVAHRRTLAVRKRQIHYINAAVIPGHDRMFQLTLVTQAGTYVKEFIHGDFGRTFPSLSGLAEVELDIFRLDVIGIDLDWPKHINSVPHPSALSITKESNIFNEVKPVESDLLQTSDGVLDDISPSEKKEPV